jgi:preprotein translocase subunit SecD
MKFAKLSLLLALLTSGCSPKTETSATVGTPQFSIAAGDVASRSVEVATNRVSASPSEQTAVVRLEFTDRKAAAFRKFTKEHLNQKVQIIVGTNVVAEPVIRAEIRSPRCELDFSSAEKAQAVVDSLREK